MLHRLKIEFMFMGLMTTTHKYPPPRNSHHIILIQAFTKKEVHITYNHINTQHIHVTGIDKYDVHTNTIIMLFFWVMACGALEKTMG